MIRYCRFRRPVRAIQRRRPLNEELEVTGPEAGSQVISTEVNDETFVFSGSIRRRSLEHG